MKTSVFALLLVVAGAFAYPQAIDNAREGRSVEDQIQAIIDGIKEIIQRANLDPLEIDNVYYENQFVPNLLEIEVFLQNLSFNGLSNIVVDDLEYTPFINRLTFQVSLPEISLSLGGAGVNLNVLGNSYEAEIRGSAAIRGFSFSGEVNLNVSILDGISVRTITLDLYFGVPEVNLSVKALGVDYSDAVNDFLQDRIPTILENNRNELNRALEASVRIIIDSIGNRP